MLNIGPGPDGTWHDEAYVRLAEIGEWMQINQDAIYDSHGKENFGKGKIRYTYMDDGSTNIFYLVDENESEMPSEIILEKHKIDQIKHIEIFGSNSTVVWEKSGSKLKIFIPETLRKDPPCDYAWVFKIS